MRRHFAVPAIVALAFPFAARADLVGTVTLATGDRFSFDTGVTFTTGSAAGDIRFSGTSVAPQGSVGIFNYKTSGAAGTTHVQQPYPAGAMPPYRLLIFGRRR